MRILSALKNSKMALFLILLLLATLNSILFGLNQTPLTGDAESYNAYAINLTLGNGYALYDSTRFDTYREPGYPFLLFLIYAIFGIQNFFFVKITQIFLLTGIAFLVYLTFSQCSYKNTGIMAAILTSAIPYYGYNTNILMSELLFSFFLTLSMYLLVKIIIKDRKMITYAVLGLFLALAVLTRSIFLFFPFFIGIVMFLTGKNVRKIICLLAVFILLITGWASYVHKNTGRFTITEGRLINHIYTRAARTTLSHKDQIYYLYSWLKRSALGGKENEILEKYEQKPLLRVIDQRFKNGESPDDIEKESIKIILNNFDNYLVGNVVEWIKLLFIEHIYPPVPSLLSRTVRAVFYFVLYGLFIIGSARSLALEKQIPRIILSASYLYLIYGWLAISSIDAYPRFNTPFLHFYLTIGIAGLADLFDNRPKKTRGRRTSIEFFDELASQRDDWKKKNYYYYNYIEKSLLPFLIPADKKIMEIGCGTGDLIFNLHPSIGYGIDTSQAMLKIAERKYNQPKFRFLVSDLENIKEKFDYIVISDTLGYVDDIGNLLKKLHPVIDQHSRIVITQYNQLWEPILEWGSKIGIRIDSPIQNWLSVKDIENLLYLSGFETIKSGNKLLLPAYIPFLSSFLNKFLVNIFPFNKLGLINYIIARPFPDNIPDGQNNPSISIIVAARNEAGMINKIIKELPTLGSKTELIFVEGHSADNTREIIKTALAEYKGDKILKFAVQDGKGKGDAVRKGFDMATGDILMIYDADMTVPPEEIPKFYHAIIENRGEFINGSRLVYPMEKQSMRTANYIGNKFFSLAFSWLLGQRIKDTLCGTKVLWKKDYEDIKTNRNFFGDFDPFGDFDLIFGAAKLNRKITDLPVHYRERTYGTTNIRRWKHGLLLLKMTAFAAKKIKFR